MLASDDIVDPSGDVLEGNTELRDAARTDDLLIKRVEGLIEFSVQQYRINQRFLEITQALIKRIERLERYEQSANSN